MAAVAVGEAAAPHSNKPAAAAAERRGGRGFQTCGVG